MRYVIFLDEFCEDIFFELEKISEGMSAHHCEVSAMSKDEAIDELFYRIKPFFETQLKEVSDEEL